MGGRPRDADQRPGGAVAGGGGGALDNGAAGAHHSATGGGGEQAALDGLYVLRTNVDEEQLDTAGVVLAYKSLAHVEQAFRHFKLSDLEVRPIYN